MNFKKKYNQFSLGFIIFQHILFLTSKISLAQTTTFVDVNAHWAEACIENLAEENIVGGDQEQQRFRPDDPMTRVELAIILTQAFPDVKPVQEPVDFVDIPSDYWAYNAIQSANRRGFLSSYIAGVFNPTLEVTRVQAIEAIVQGLNYQAELISVEQLRTIYNDINEIPETAQTAIAAATENWLVVNYPNVKQLNPSQRATRAEVAAIICQALAEPQETALVPSQYIARVPVNRLSTTARRNPSLTREDAELNPQEIVEESQKESTVTEPENQDLSAVESNDAEDLENQTEIRETEIRETEIVKVELLYETPDVVQLTFIRKGEQRLSESIALSSSQSQNSYDQLIDVHIIDLDNDNEPEIMIDFVGKDSSNRPVYYSLIYRYSFFSREYKDTKQIWGRLPYERQDSNFENQPIFISFDRRFSQNYQTEIPEHLPLQIWQYESGEMQDQTSAYPEIVEKQTATLWLELNQPISSQNNLQGIIAAYLANKSVLGEVEEGWQRVQQIYQERNATSFFNELRQFLRETGYLEE
ncbi:MAG: S-layer homology domain-containing protein [Microcoleaceae cyanobacterium]